MINQEISVSLVKAWATEGVKLYLMDHGTNDVQLWKADQTWIYCCAAEAAKPESLKFREIMELLWLTEAFKQHTNPHFLQDLWTYQLASWTEMLNQDL